MKFCSECGSDSLELRIPSGDNRPRYVCGGCGVIHYQNPKVVAGCILEWQDRVLLCRRAIEPRYGYWTLPAGFMETGESSVEAAAREALEEANALVEELILYGVYNLPHISQVYLMFRGGLHEGRASAGHETLEVGLFGEREIPWSELAFPVVADTLRQFFRERTSGDYRVHTVDIARGGDGKVSMRRHP